MQEFMEQAGRYANSYQYQQKAADQVYDLIVPFDEFKRSVKPFYQKGREQKRNPEPEGIGQKH